MPRGDDSKPPHGLVRKVNFYLRIEKVLGGLIIFCFYSKIKVFISIFAKLRF